MSDDKLEFPLYLSNVRVYEAEYVELVLEYSGDDNLVDRVLIVGKNNNFSSDYEDAHELKKVSEGGRTFYEITLNIFEEGEFRAVVEYQGQYIPEPGILHSISIQDRRVFFDGRQVFRLMKDFKPPKTAKKEKSKKKGEETEKTQQEMDKPKTTEEKKQKKAKIAPAYDKDNNLTIQPKEFRHFDENLRIKILQVLDYLTNEESKKLKIDGVMLPDIARSLKRCITDEQRYSVYLACFPVIIVIEKALILSKMVHNQIVDDENIERYQQEVATTAEELKDALSKQEFTSTNNLVLVEYNEDMKSLKKVFYSQI